jgi:hypothetical protein
MRYRNLIFKYVYLKHSILASILYFSICLVTLVVYKSIYRQTSHFIYESKILYFWTKYPYYWTMHSNVLVYKPIASYIVLAASNWVIVPLLQALDTFNTAIVSPIYYVMFTTLTILASIIMFKVNFSFVLISYHMSSFCSFIRVKCLFGIFVICLLGPLWETCRLCLCSSCTPHL